MWQALGVGVEVGAVLYALAWVGALWFLGLYQLRVRWTISGELNDILVASLILAAATMSFLFLVKLEEVIRLFLLILLVSQPIVTMATRLFLRAVFAGMRERSPRSWRPADRALRRLTRFSGGCLDSSGAALTSNSRHVAGAAGGQSPVFTSRAPRSRAQAGPRAFVEACPRLGEPPLRRRTWR